MRHKLSVLVENRFGELSRIVGLFSARGLNIESLSVAETLDPSVSRMTMVTAGDDHAIEQITKQVRVLSALDMTDVKHIEREMVLISVNTEPGPSRQEVLILADLYRAEIVDVSHDGITLEATGDWDKISALVELLRPIGIREIVRTGTVAIARLTEEALGAKNAAASQSV